MILWCFSFRFVFFSCARSAHNPFWNLRKEKRAPRAHDSRRIRVLHPLCCAQSGRGIRSHTVWVGIYTYADCCDTFLRRANQLCAGLFGSRPLASLPKRFFFFFSIHRTVVRVVNHHVSAGTASVSPRKFRHSYSHRLWYIVRNNIFVGRYVGNFLDLGNDFFFLPFSPTNSRGIPTYRRLCELDDDKTDP